MAQGDTNLTSLVLDKALTVGGRLLNVGSTYELFKSNPVTAAVGGGAASGTAQTANAMLFPGNAFEYAALGTQTITAPSLLTGGLNIGMDQTNNDGVEITQGILSRSKHAYTIDTDSTFYLRVKFSIEDVSGTDDCAIGFRKLQAYQANIDDYTDMAVLNVISGDIKIETILNNAATVTTDTTQNWADGETHTLEVRVDETGAVTYLIDGAAPTVTAAFTFDTTDVVVPFIYFLNDTDLAGQVNLIEYECGKLKNL